MSRRTVSGWTLVLGAVAAIVLVAVTLPGAAREMRRHGYWGDGLGRLCVALVTDRTDAGAPWAAAAGLGAALLTATLRRRPPSRRACVAAAAVLGGLTLLRGAVAIDRCLATRGRPNLLLISIDTLRADGLGAYGNRRDASPVLDRRLAADGVVFERVFSQSPKTTPSHVTMLTSLPPCAHGVALWDRVHAVRNLSPRVQTLAEVLRNAGYTTVAFTGGAHMMGRRGLADGFEQFVEGDGRELGPAARWIKHHRHGRWFLFFHTFEVHDPYVPPIDLERRFAPDAGPRLRAVVGRLRDDASVWDDRHRVFWSAVDREDPSTIRSLRGLYEAGIAHMDRSTVTTLLDTLDRFDLARDTLVVFTSDHGEAFGEHGQFLHDDLHATTTRVPLILRWPGRVPQGQRITTPVRLLDLMPTVLELLGIGGPPTMQGRSLVSLLDGGPAATPLAAMSEYDPPGAPALAAWREGPLTLLADGTHEELFDTAADPEEMHDLGPERPHELTRMRSALAQWRTRCQVLAAALGPGDEASMPAARTVEQLRALGYVE